MTRKPYEKPAIIKHRSGLGNKFGAPTASRSLSRIDGVSVQELLARFGSPLFVLSEKTIRRKFREATRAFANRYPRVTFGWSYKTNYLDAVCALYHQLGAWAEVVSEYEYEMALRLGVPPDRIIFNGPYKPDGALQQAVENGTLVNIDNMDEISTLDRITRQANRTAEVGIRVNLDAGIYPVWDRFGFNLENGQALMAARRVQAAPQLELTTLHAHIGTYILDAGAYGKLAEKLTEFAVKLQDSVGIRIRRFDLGGGFASRNTLHTQYGSGADAAPDFDEYAEAATQPLLAHFSHQGDPPELVLETGRALIDEAGYLIATVVGSKRLSNGLRGLIVDAGVNVLFTSFWYRHDVYPAQDHHGGLIEDTVIYGPLCMNIDVMRPSVQLPNLTLGDQLVFKNVGAYNMTQWLQFIRMRPAVVLVGTDGTPLLIREPEDLSDIKRREHLPARLRLKEMSDDGQGMARQVAGIGR